MKICLITRECFPFFSGGIGTAFYSLGKVLSKLDHEVIVLTKKPYNFDENLYRQHYSNNFQLEWVDYTEGAFSAHGMLDYSFQLEKHFGRFNDSFKADVVIYAEYDGEAYFLLQEKSKGKYNNTPFVIHYSGPLFAVLEAESRILTVYEEIIILMEKYCIQETPFAIAPSSFILDYLKQRLNLAHQQQFIIPNPINNTIFIEPAPATVIPDNGEKIILFIGRLAKTKGVDYLLKAFQQVIEAANNGPVRLRFIGNDVFWNDYNSTFEEYCRKNLPENILSKIDFIGHISQQEMLAYIKHAWIAVFPSRFETFGNVALECIYCGTPVLVNKNTGLLSVIGNDYNFFWDPESGVPELTTLLQNVLADADLRNKLAQKAHEQALELHTRLPDHFIHTLQEIITTANKQLPAAPSANTSEQLFLLLNQYSALRLQERNAEAQTGYHRKDEEIRKAWDSYHHKNDEFVIALQQHEAQLKEIWNKLNEKDDQINEWQAKLEALKLQLVSLSRDVEKDLHEKKAAGSPIEIPTREDLLPEIERLYDLINSLKQKKRRLF